MMKYILAVLILTVMASAAFAQQVPKEDFETFQKRLYPKDDVIYVFNFWATWCKPCVEELPHFEELNETYADTEVKVVLVSLDFANQYKSRLLPFVKAHNLQSEVLMLDAPKYNEWIDKVSPEWGGSIPATLVVHPNTNTWKFYEKQFASYNDLNKIVKSVLNKLP